MTIDWLYFTPWTSLEGGLLIGLAVAILLLFNERITGISSILGGLFNPAKNDFLWRFVFALELIISPFFFNMLSPLPEVRIDAKTYTLIVAGLFVGIGTRYDSGCTSGHGACRLSRQSLRSVVATIIFIIAGFLTVSVIRHTLA